MFKLLVILILIRSTKMIFYKFRSLCPRHYPKLQKTEKSPLPLLKSFSENKYLDSSWIKIIF